MRVISVKGFYDHWMAWTFYEHGYEQNDPTLKVIC